MVSVWVPDQSPAVQTCHGKFQGELTSILYSHGEESGEGGGQLVAQVAHKLRCRHCINGAAYHTIACPAPLINVLCAHTVPGCEATEGTALTYVAFPLWHSLWFPGNRTSDVTRNGGHRVKGFYLWDFLSSLSSPSLMKRDFRIASASKRPDFSTWTISPDDSNRGNRLNWLDVRTLSDSMDVS
jgi:hypothetical protein